MNKLTTNANLIQNIAQIIEQARNHVRQTVNSAMVLSYWEIGRLLVEDEQQGNHKAEYGKYTLKTVSERLTEMFGKGFDERNLRKMRQFYLSFPIRDALRPELSWTHYRSKISTILTDGIRIKRINRKGKSKIFSKITSDLFFQKIGKINFNA